MADISAAVTSPVAGAYNTSTAYSGTFIPTLWSSKLNSKFYTATMFGEIANTNWEGEIKGMGDKVVINNIPTLTVNDYVVGAGLTYEVPTPSTIELVINKGKYFAFQVNDVLSYQSNIGLMDTFSNDASMQMKIKIDSTVILNSLFGSNSGTFGGAPAAANLGATAGVKSGGYDLGTVTAPIGITASPSTTLLKLLTAFSGVLDEQNVPETDRFLVIDPLTRNLLMQTNLAQAQFMGDPQSMLRNGKIGSIDRFTVYVSNNLPKAAANSTAMYAGDGSEYVTVTTHTTARRAIFAGHKSALSFASQMTKVEQVRNPNDFGDYIRGLNVFGYKVVKPEALTMAYVL